MEELILRGIGVDDAFEALHGPLYTGDGDRPSQIAVVHSEVRGLYRYAAIKARDDKFKDYTHWWAKSGHKLAEISGISGRPCTCLWMACKLCKQAYHNCRVREKVEENCTTLVDLRGKDDNLHAYASRLKRLVAELVEEYLQDLEHWRLRQSPPDHGHAAVE